jgi:pimeloyl-ACP methyl ester carboxylesterase
MDNSPHESRLVEVNGIRLHYLDWGGNGPILLFLARLGCNAHIFDKFALRFTGGFHVMALTRRGHGESDHPETGYDIDTLTEDINQFLRGLDIDQVFLAGHSLAGVELTRFAVLHPDMVRGLVYLDAAYDRSSQACRDMEERYPLKGIQPPGANESCYSPESYFDAMKRNYPSFQLVWDEAMDTQARHEIRQEPDGKVVDKLTDSLNGALVEMTHTYVPEDAKVRAPALGILAIDNGPYLVCAEWMTEAQKAQLLNFYETPSHDWIQGNIDAFRRNLPHARVLVIPQGHHYVFMKSAERVYEEMRGFLESTASGLQPLGEP